jgi:diadenosine tetraphosphate (Ap4A) HIT family hydrolase
VFELHDRLAQDTVPLGRFPLSRVLLMNDSRYPWVVLVPERPGAAEIWQLAEDDQQQLARESAAVARALSNAFGAERVNVAALGNIVPQLHVHHVVRHRGDAAWPGPVWGRFEPQPYESAALAAMRAAVRGALAGLADFAAIDPP